MAEAKTQAVGAIGAVLLAAGGVTATIGIFEAQEHRSAVGWFTCCAACFIAAILIPVITFVFLPWIEYLGGKKTTGLQVEAPAPKTKTTHEKDDAARPIPVQLDDRVMLNVTPGFLVENRRNYKTDVEAGAALQRYLGKWMQVSGTIGNMSFADPQAKTTLFVRVEEEPASKKKSFQQTLDSLEKATAMLVFTDQKWIDRLVTFNHGDSIEALGKLTSVDHYGVVLQSCELIDPVQATS
jgi:hypothetical protein